MSSQYQRHYVLFLIVSVTAAGVPASASAQGKSAWVYPGPRGKLVYETTPAGDRILDFSHAGYMGGGVALPILPVPLVLRPSGADDTAAIQTAIDSIALAPLRNGFRGAVLLSPGTFICAEPIMISASGIVLSGSGSNTEDERSTTIKLVGKPHNGITVASAVKNKAGDEPAAQKQVSAKTKISDDYVPSGATSIHVVDAKGFNEGDTIAIRKTVTADWVKFMQMDDLVRDGKKQTWLAVGRVLTTERQIKGIYFNKIVLDVPLSDSFDTKYFQPAGFAVVKIKPSYLSQVGVEHLRIESPPQAFPHTQPHFSAIKITGEDCWVRDVVCDETMDSVAVMGRRITLQQVTVNRKALHEGASRPGEFAPDATQTLMDRCNCNADNVWFSWTGSGDAGPIVLLNCTFHGDGRAEAHMRWSTGMLYDNCKAPEGGLDMRNRGVMGSGHGWSMGWGVAWNCSAKFFTIQNPPGAINWMIGCGGPNHKAPRPFDKGTPNLPEGTIDSPATTVAPQSLYLRQLEDRLGSQALRNIGY
jgi:hypothetical protein